MTKNIKCEKDNYKYSASLINYLYNELWLIHKTEAKELFKVFIEWINKIVIPWKHFHLWKLWILKVKYSKLIKWSWYMYHLTPSKWWIRIEEKDINEHLIRLKEVNAMKRARLVNIDNYLKKWIVLIDVEKDIEKDIEKKEDI